MRITIQTALKRMLEEKRRGDLKNWMESLWFLLFYFILHQKSTSEQVTKYSVIL